MCVSVQTFVSQDRLRGTAEFRQRMEKMVGRFEAMNLELKRTRPADPAAARCRVTAPSGERNSDTHSRVNWEG
jgi:hypothetical protein